MNDQLIKNLDSAIEKVLGDATAIPNVTQDELEQVLGLVVQAFQEESDNLAIRLEKDISDGDKAYYAQCTKALDDCRRALEAQIGRIPIVEKKYVDGAIQEAIARVKLAKGEQGIPGIQGEPGKPGKDGSPDTPDEVVDKVNKGKTLIKKERVEGLSEFDKLRSLGAFNPTLGPSFKDLENLGNRITTINNTVTANKALSINFIIDGGGSAITTGVKGFVEIPYNMTVTGWQIFGDQVGSVVVDVWKDTYANFPPVVGDSITGTEKPTLASAQSNQDLNLTTWTTALSQGDILAYNVDSVSTVTRITVSIIGTKN